MYIEISKKGSKKFTTYIKQMDKIYLEYDLNNFIAYFTLTCKVFLILFLEEKSLIFYTLLKF